ALAEGERRLQARVRDRVARLERVLPRSQRPAPRDPAARGHRRLPGGDDPDRDTRDGAAPCLVGALRDPRPRGRRAPGRALTPSGRSPTLNGELTFVPAIDPEVSSMLTGR